MYPKNYSHLRQKIAKKKSTSEGNSVILKRSKEKIKYKDCIYRDDKNLRTSKPDK